MIGRACNSSFLKDVDSKITFWGGVAMSSPFYAEFFSWRYSLFLIIPFLFFRLCKPWGLKKPAMVYLPMVSLLFLHFAALLFSDTRFSDYIVKETILACSLLLIALLSDGDIQKGFFASIVPLAVVTACLALVKAGLLDRGWYIFFIFEKTSSYPPGSALHVNYNNLGFLWLVASLGLLKSRFYGALAFLVAAGLLLTSRRFVALILFLPIFWFFLQGRLAVSKIFKVLILSVVLIFVVADPDSFNEYRWGHKEWSFLEVDIANILHKKTGFVSDTARMENISFDNAFVSTSDPVKIVRTGINNEYFGTASRLEFWSLGWSLIGFFPQGFSYHEAFSCAFSPCSDYHWPHMTIISEWIIGGVVFGFISVLFFFWPFFFVVRSKNLVSIGLYVLFLPYALISGDTVFSLPICVSCMLVALGSARSVEDSVADKVSR